MSWCSFPSTFIIIGTIWSYILRASPKSPFTMSISASSNASFNASSSMSFSPLMNFSKANEVSSKLLSPPSTFVGLGLPAKTGFKVDADSVGFTSMIVSCSFSLSLCFLRRKQKQKQKLQNKSKKRPHTPAIMYNEVLLILLDGGSLE